MANIQHFTKRISDNNRGTLIDYLLSEYMSSPYIELDYMDFFDLMNDGNDGSHLQITEVTADTFKELVENLDIADANHRSMLIILNTGNMEDLRLEDLTELNRWIDDNAPDSRIQFGLSHASDLPARIQMTVFTMLKDEGREDSSETDQDNQDAETVYIVVDGEFDECEIIQVFKSKELAEKYIDSEGRSNMHVVKYRIMTQVDSRDGFFSVEITVPASQLRQVRWCRNSAPDCMGNSFQYTGRTDEYRAISFCVPGTSAKEAIKAAREMFKVIMEHPELYPEYKTANEAGKYPVYSFHEHQIVKYC